MQAQGEHADSTHCGATVQNTAQSHITESYSMIRLIPNIYFGMLMLMLANDLDEDVEDFAHACKTENYIFSPKYHARI